jgi:adenylate cyclase
VAHVWLPLFTPLVLQMPCFLILLSLTQYWQKRRSHQQMHNALRRYVPDAVVEKYLKQVGQLRMLDIAEQVQGVCMATDAGQYTRLSEQLTPHALHDLMNAYYAVLFAEITQQQGIISDVIGDAAMALWVKTEDDLGLRRSACYAALAIQAANAVFNREHLYPLPTRIGVHCGEMHLGNIGAGDHFEYRAVGDTVNTAARIESLNKLLGTDILVSAQVLEGLSEFWARDLGVFILKGKTLPIHILELSQFNRYTTIEWQALCVDFAAALALYQAFAWEPALSAFQRLQQRYPQDGPTRFYAHFLQQNLPRLVTQAPETRSAWIDTETTILR